MAGIFISYRRQDSAGHARALYDRLRPRFPGQVFMDVAGGISPGVDFVDVIEKAIDSCRALIVIIGREWVTGTDPTGRRRLDDPNDFIRLEVATALRRDVVVIPALVEDALMPTALELPEDLARLARRQALELRDTRWDADVEQLVLALGRALEKDSAAEASRGAAVTPTTKPTDDARSRRTEPMRTADAHSSENRVTAQPAREAPTKRRSKGSLAMVAILTVVAASVAGYLWVESARGSVPNLVGQSFDSARDRLRSEGLVLGETTTRRTKRVDPGQVLQQSPGAGTRVWKGASIALVLAERQPAVVPNVVTLPLADARAKLSDAGISVSGVKREETEVARPDSVLAVEPGVGTEMAGDAPAVELVVAVSPERLGRAWLGIQMQAVPEAVARTLKMVTPRGAYIVGVTPDSPAAVAGLERGNVILGADRQQMRDNVDLSRYVKSLGPGTTITLEVLREGGIKYIRVTLGTLPDKRME